MGMTTKNMLETLDSTKMVQKASQSSTPLGRPAKIIDWPHRLKEKNRLFYRHITLLFILVTLSIVAINISRFWINTNTVQSLFLSLPPILLLILSWIIPGWLFLYNPALLLPTTLGAIPIHIVWIVAFVYLVKTFLPHIEISVLVTGMMGHWVLFSIVEISMLHHFCKIE